MIIRAFEAYLYVEVFEIIEYRNGTVYKTKSKGYAKADRPKQSNELYCAISTRKFIQGQFETTLL
jgi:hypothetical protein